MLWDRKKPLNQPPSFGRLSASHAEKPASDHAKAAQRALSDAQLDRQRQIQRYGGRHAVVQG